MKVRQSEPGSGQRAREQFLREAPVEQPIYFDLAGGAFEALGADPRDRDPNGYVYAGNEPIRWIDPDAGTKTEGIPGDDPFYWRLYEAAQARDRDLICAIEKEAKGLFRDGSITKKRFRNIQKWVKLAKDGRLLNLIVPLCIGDSVSCKCVNEPDQCRAIWADQ